VCVEIDSDTVRLSADRYSAKMIGSLIDNYQIKVIIGDPNIIDERDLYSKRYL